MLGNVVDHVWKAAGRPPPYLVKQQMEQITPADYAKTLAENIFGKLFLFQIIP
jgi:hypothetical protein